MAKVVTDNQYYTAIANAIRALTGTNNRYTPAQMAPAIISYIAGGIDLSNVEPYFLADVANAMNYVNELGEGWIHHIVVSDSHFTRNYGHSTAIVKAMQDSGKFSKVIHLGDITDDAQEANYTEAIANYGQFNGDLLFAIGNHDAQGSYGWETYWYENLLDESTDIVVDSSSNYNYYWDDSEHSIRYIVYDYHTGGDTYALNRIKDAPSGYAVITMCHYKNLLNETILVPLIGHKVDYIGNIAGHQHREYKYSKYVGMYNEVVVSNDGNANDNANYVKTDNTNESQAITIMSINTTTRNAKFYRIGMATFLGKQWEYTWVKGGSVETWIKGGYWGTGALTSADNGYYSAKLYPALDDNDNAITYHVKCTTGTLTYGYILGMNSSGDWAGTNRLAQPLTAVWNRVGFWQKKSSTNKFTAVVTDYLVSFNNGLADMTSTDGISITTERITLGREFANASWETGTYLNSSAANTTEEGSVASYAFDILPSTTYRFYVDDADWAGTNYLYAFLYKDQGSAAKDFYPLLSRRLGSGTAGTKEITFTTNSTEYYCRISSRSGLANVENFASKCHLEVVNS